MRVLGKSGGYVMLCAWIVSANACGQSLIWNDTLVICTVSSPTNSAASPVWFRLAQEMEYSVSCSNLLFINWKQGDNTSLVSLIHHFKYRSQFTNTRKVKINNSFTHDLGIQYYFDSISRFQPDENTLNTQVEICIWKNLSFSVFSNLTTRIFNSYLYTSNRPGNYLKTLGAAFLTPLLWTFSTGVGWTIPQLGAIKLGLSAGKFTWIRSREVYEQQNIMVFYGVPKDKRLLFEYGLSMHLLVDKDFLKSVHWNCDFLIFKNYRKPIDMVMKNFIGVRISKFLKTSIQTRLYYENEVSKRLQVENLVSLGFYFNL